MAFGDEGDIPKPKTGKVNRGVVARRAAANYQTVVDPVN
jgi:hypothetical protein